MGNMESLPQLDASAETEHHQRRLTLVAAVAVESELIPDVAVPSEDQQLFGD